MIKYENGKIYKLTNDINDLEYIGSSCLELAERLENHQRLAKQRPDQKIYKQLNEIGWDHVSIILIEAYPCNNKIDLLKRERYWIEQLRPKLNQYIPSRTRQEWLIDNPEAVKRYIKKYVKTHHAQIVERGKRYRESHKTEARLYYEANKEKIKARAKEHNMKNREKNREKFNEAAKLRRVKCEICNLEMRSSSFSRHNKRKGHPDIKIQ